MRALLAILAVIWLSACATFTEATGCESGTTVDCSGVFCECEKVASPGPAQGRI